MAQRGYGDDGGFSFTVSGPPRPKQSWRKGSKGAYIPPKTRRYMNDMKMCALAARPDGWPTDARYSLTIIPHFPDLRRRDLDNLEKTVGDALNGIIWDDDSQIDEVYKRRHLDRENPRVEITITIINPDEGW